MAEERDRFAAEPAHLTVGQDGFETVADLREVGVVLNGEEDQDATIFLLWTDAPVRGEVEGVLLGRKVAERFHGDDGDLGLGLVVNLGAEGGELGLGAGAEDAGEVVDVAGVFEVLGLLGRCAGGEKRGEASEGEAEREETRRPAARNYPLRMAGERVGRRGVALHRDEAWRRHRRAGLYLCQRLDRVKDYGAASGRGGTRGVTRFGADAIFAGCSGAYGSVRKRTPETPNLALSRLNSSGYAWPLCCTDYRSSETQTLARAFK